jgi:hypothetical protein
MRPASVRPRDTQCAGSVVDQIAGNGTQAHALHQRERLLMGRRASLSQKIYSASRRLGQNRVLAATGTIEMKQLVRGFSTFRPEKIDVVMAVTVVAAFLITFFVLWRERQADPPLTATMTTASIPVQSAGRKPTADFAAPRQLAAQSSRVATPIAEVAAAAIPVDTAKTPRNTSDNPLPVDISFRRQRGDGAYLEGSILNKSDEDLPVAVEFFSAQSKRTSKIELIVPANHASAFGRDDGLEIEGGEEVTIKNPAYAETHMQVR